MSPNFKHFGLGTSRSGHRAIYGDTMNGDRLWIMHVNDVFWIGATRMLDMLNASIAEPDGEEITDEAIISELLATLEAARLFCIDVGQTRWDSPLKEIRAVLERAKGESA